MAPAFFDYDLPAAFLQLSGGIALIYGTWKYMEARRSPLNAIPTVGYSGVLTSYLTALRWNQDAVSLIQEGYDRYGGKPFKVATTSRWMVIVGGTKYVNDLRQFSVQVLSFRGAIAERLQLRYTLEQTFADDPEDLYHVDVIRTPVTRNLAAKFDDIRDEVVVSFKDYIPLTEEWKAIPAYPTLLHIVCRVSNRYFVGLPLCREPGYRTLNENFALDVASSARIINCFPDLLKPIVGRYLTTIPKSVKQITRYLGPVLEERLAQYKLHGTAWEEKPNDLITWLIENAKWDYHHTVEDMSARILSVNFAAINNTSMVITHALYDLAIHPEYVEAMRKEVEDVIQEYGWEKGSMLRMRKVDSFLKESQRLNNIVTLRMLRKALRDVTLPDGTFIPEGTFTALANDAMCKDENIFPDAHTFNGFRFAELREGSGELDSIKHQMVALNLDHVVFGHGVHACPGRFLAVNELKMMFAHILINYDVQLENGSMERPTNQRKEAIVMPNPKAKVMFRKRRAQ